MGQEKEFEIIRELNAPIDLVWKMHTQAEHLAKWWGPKGFKMLKCDLNFNPNGIFHYGMESPDGNKMWGKLTVVVLLVSFYPNPDTYYHKN